MEPDFGKGLGGFEYLDFSLSLTSLHSAAYETFVLLIGRPAKCSRPDPGGKVAAYLCRSPSFLHLHPQTKRKCLAEL